MIVSVDGEKAFDKIQHPFIVKNFSKQGIELIFKRVSTKTYSYHCI